MAVSRMVTNRRRLSLTPMGKANPFCNLLPGATAGQVGVVRSERLLSVIASTDRRLSVVIVAFNSLGVIGDLLESVREDGAAEEVVVVDNGSRDGTQGFLRAQPGVTVVEQGNAGYANGVNTALALVSRGHDVLVLNPDVIVSPGAITRLCTALESAPDVGIATPALRDPSGELAPSLRRRPSSWRVLAEALVGGRFASWAGERWTPRSTGPQEAVWATGAALLLRRDMLEQLGPFSEAYFMYSEETEYCLRARDAGWRLVCEPAAEVLHIGGDMSSNDRLWALRAVNRVRLHRRRYGRVRGIGMRVASIAFEGRRVVSGSRVSRVALRSLLRIDLDAAAVELVVSLGGDPEPMLRSGDERQ